MEHTQTRNNHQPAAFNYSKGQQVLLMIIFYKKKFSQNMAFYVWHSRILFSVLWLYFASIFCFIQFVMFWCFIVITTSTISGMWNQFVSYYNVSPGEFNVIDYLVFIATYGSYKFQFFFKVFLYFH